MYKLGRFSPAIRAQMIYTPPYENLIPVLSNVFIYTYLGI